MIVPPQGLDVPRAGFYRETEPEESCWPMLPYAQVFGYNWQAEAQRINEILREQAHRYARRRAAWRDLLARRTKLQLIDQHKYANCSTSVNPAGAAEIHRSR